MRSIFVEDQPTTLPEDGLTTRAEAEAVVVAANKLALGGGCVRVDVSPFPPSSGDDKAREITFANGKVVNAGVLKGALKNANPTQLAELQAEYSAPSLNGPSGVNWACTESEYHAARNAAAAVGLVVIGGGTISDGADDIEAIGRQSFGLPPQGNGQANFVIAFAPKPGYEAPVANAAFLAHMLSAAGPEGGKQFVAARMMPKGWRAS
jgi:hypothetical protein